MHAWLVDARLSYDRARGRRSLATALRLAEPEQLRLPFDVERSSIGPVLRRDPKLAHVHRCLLPPGLRREQLPALPGAPEQAAILAGEPLSEREREVLRRVSAMMSTAEVAREMYISVNTVKSHLKNIYRKPQYLRFRPARCGSANPVGGWRGVAVAGQLRRIRPLMVR